MCKIIGEHEKKNTVVQNQCTTVMDDSKCSNNFPCDKMNKLKDKLLAKYGTTLYDFSRITEYTSKKQKVQIQCKHCSTIKQVSIDSLLRGIASCICITSGFCNKRTNNQFITECKEKFKEDYSYEKTNYVSSKQKVIIVCRSCNKEFEIVPWRFLKNNQGCPHCSLTRTWSTIAITCLNMISEKSGFFIKHAKNLGEEKVCIGKSTYKADGFIKELNLVIEYNGDVFHGNPKLFKDNDTCHPFCETTAKELYLKTLLKEQQLKRSGFKVLTIWENDFKTNKIQTVAKAVQFIKKIKQNGEKQ